MPKTEAGMPEATDVLARARADYDIAFDRERENIRLAYDDLEFLAGDDNSQWPSQQKLERMQEGRPVLQINQLPQFIHQITNDIRQMRPAIKVVPVDGQADEKIADLRAGLIRYIENRSDAAAIYFRAADSQVACGIGHWRVLTEYADGSTFNQEIRIAPVDDAVAVLWDPDSSLPTKEDARFCFVPVDMTRNKFKALYPDKVPTEFDDPQWTHNADWVSDDHVRVAEYWVRKPKKKTLAMTPDGSVADITDADASVLAFYERAGARIEERESTQICRYLISASDILEGPEEWPGRFIPVVPVLGEETRIGRKVVRKGIVRDAKDPQRMSNYFHSAHTEVVALQPKAPFILTETNVNKYQEIWEQANTKNFPYLTYQPDPQNGGQLPQRVQPPVSSQGVLDGLTMAREDLRAVIGIYDASLGKQGNETSGKAILARQREGDTGSFHYIDSFSRAVRHTGNIINDLIPHIYDTQRTIRIMGEDGKIDVMEINRVAGMDPVSGQTVYEHDVTVGAYDVVAEIGPSYATRREESREGMMNFIQTAPEAGSLILDLVAKAQDWPMAKSIEERLKTVLPPKILQVEALQKQGVPQEQIDQILLEQASQPPPPDPAIEVQKAKLELDAAGQQQDMQFSQQKHALEMAQSQQEFEQKMAFEREKHAAEMSLRSHEMQANAALREYEINTSAQTKREQMEANAKPSAEIKLDANEAVKGMAPMMQEQMDASCQMMGAAAQALTQAAAALTQVAQVIAAPIEIDRDAQGRAKGAHRIINTTLQ